MAFGSAAPEIIINAVSTVKSAAAKDEDGANATSLGIGAILGSGMIAFMVIPATCAMSATETLRLKRRPLTRDIVTYGVALACLCVFFGDGEIQLFPDAVSLVLIYVVYITVLVVSPKIRRHYRLRQGKVVRTTTFVEEQRRSNRAKEEKRRLQAEKDSMKTALLEENSLIISADDLEEGGADNDLKPDADGLKKETPPTKYDDDDDDKNAPMMGSSSTGGYVSLNEDNTSKQPSETLRMITTAFEYAIAPVRFAFEWTCPDCAVWSDEENAEEGRPEGTTNPTEWMWPITFVVSFLWVSVFSFVISAIVTRWCDLLHADVGFFGMAIVAVGAEIPDTIQSVTVAKRGYGAMAVSNCLGSQICNICLGLGLPWTISNLLNHKVSIAKEKNLQHTAFFQVGIVVIAFVTLVGFALIQGANKASLTKTKGKLYLCVYAIVLIVLAVLTFK